MQTSKWQTIATNRRKGNAYGCPEIGVPLNSPFMSFRCSLEIPKRGGGGGGRKTKKQKTYQDSWDSLYTEQPSLKNKPPQSRTKMGIEVGPLKTRDPSRWLRVSCWFPYNFRKIGPPI